MHVALLAPQGIDLQLVVLKVLEDIADVLTHRWRHGPFSFFFCDTVAETVIGSHASHLRLVLD